ncbi:MAG: O-antigen ligase family protein, partial [Anaerolineales bacterium]
ITSFPLVERTIGGDTVSPLSLVPLVVLVAAWLIPYLLRGESLPSEAGPLLLFALVAVSSSLLAQFLPIGPYKGQAVLSRSLRGLATLGIGLCFYLVASLICFDPNRARSSLRAITAGGLLALLWSAAQAWYILFIEGYIPPLLNQIHRWLSVRDLFWDRVTGLAFEPSWFGNQLVTLYLPLWLASVVTGISAFGRTRKFMLVEAGCSIVAVVMLLLSRSRLSLVSFLLMLAALTGYGLWRATGWLVKRTWRSVPVSASRLSRGLQPVLLLVGVFALSAGLVAVARAAIERDPRTSRLLSTPSQLDSIRIESPYETVYAVANRAAFAERLVYWRAGFWPFERYPVLGVGLGNAGFFFEDGLPAYAHRLVEIQNLLDPANRNFPNPKSLWLRVLAETGLVGFSAFLIWLGVLAVGGITLIKGGVGIDRAIGVAGLLAILAQLSEGFSLDTFALPQLWIMLGLLTAAAKRQRQAYG